ncbi:MAG: P-II family nitrogen regulator [Clostridia bacterium]|nr:P-II family nitrogen regulator [Clostridia bacterium]
MSKLYLMCTVLNRARLPEFLSLYRQERLDRNFIMLAHGTATSTILNTFGLENSEKAVSLTVVTDAVWKDVKKGLERRIRIDIPGTGIAFLVPISSIGGRRELAFFTEDLDYQRDEEETELKGTKQELLIVIGNRGYSEQIMDAAREAGATGGTVIHANGTGMKRAEKFFGISLSSERELILIVTATPKKNAIMQSIMKKAGLETDAKAVVFSLPVTDAAGLRLSEPEETEEEQAAEPEKPASAD